MTAILGLRQPLVWFSNEMERKLQENDHKTGWENMTANELLHRLKEETGELERAIARGENVVDEAADVANFAMMIADNFNNYSE